MTSNTVGGWHQVNEHRIARADIFFFGGLVAACLGGAIPVGASQAAQIVRLAVILVSAPMLGTLAALLVAGRPVTAWPFMWAATGGVGATFIGLASVVVVYDLLLIAFASIATVAFVVLLVVAVAKDRRVWARALRLILVPATIALVVASWPSPGSSDALGIVLLATWPLAGAAILAPAPWRLEPALPDDSEFAG